MIPPDNGGIRDDESTPVYRNSWRWKRCGATRRSSFAAKHKVHPNQVSAWKRQAMDGLSAVFSNGAEKARMDHDGEIHDLHAKIGQLTVERDFLARGLKR